MTTIDFSANHQQSTGGGYSGLAPPSRVVPGVGQTGAVMRWCCPRVGRNTDRGRGTSREAPRPSGGIGAYRGVVPSQPEINLDEFRLWAIGNLVDNRNRGLFAEWLVGIALGVVAADAPRAEWDRADLRYRDRLIEVKASGRGQTWTQAKPSTPRFCRTSSARTAPGTRRARWEGDLLRVSWLDQDHPGCDGVLTTRRSGS